MSFRFHQDDRGIRYCDIFPEIGKGDINVTVIESGAVALWHRHEHQSDYQLVVKGSLKIGMCNMPLYKMMDDVDYKKSDLEKEWKEKYFKIYCNIVYSDEPKNFLFPNVFSKNESKVYWHYLSEKSANRGPLFIPAGLWHGCYNYTDEQAILIYHITNKWDGKDEDRCDPEMMGWDYTRQIK